MTIMRIRLTKKAAREACEAIARELRHELGAWGWHWGYYRSFAACKHCGYWIAFNLRGRERDELDAADLPMRPDARKPTWVNGTIVTGWDSSPYVTTKKCPALRSRLAKAAWDRRRKTCPTCDGKGYVRILKHIPDP